MHRYHECKSLPEKGITIIYSNEFLSDDKHVWNMIVERTAEEADLEENHYLEEVGDTIWQTIVEIYCCPFCGDSLSTSKRQVMSADIVHYDNWHSCYGSKL
ncbi:hypothetical protein D5R81_19865 [Parashewanella spongiae]|uniref:Uncharacterized protein n=1 Tax=Parashewanella spongiae TaxID=342950 RepID=A0A3A6SSV6_9GAMM|nr:hypothetical protein D5R81_19865 [Parashewanella spongiae]